MNERTPLIVTTTDAPYTTGKGTEVLKLSANSDAKYAASAVALLLLINVFLTNQSPTEVTQGANLRSSLASFPGAADEILNLFGKPQEYDSRIFSGYLPLDNGGEAFYFLAESQSDTADKDPVLLWLNGGPGASSLSGCFSENGPLLVNDDGQSLRVNDYAWNKNAHLLCIESPVGVGFSYNNSGVYVSDDLSQADDLYNALQQFYVKYPQLRANDFIIAGESYGGIYVPTTARAIVEGNAKGDLPVINLKKFVVGNGVNEYSALSMVLYAYYHGILSTEDYEWFRSSCPQLKEFEKSPEIDPNSSCGQATAKIASQLFTSGVNPYDVAGKCVRPSKDEREKVVTQLLQGPKGFPHPVGGGESKCLDSSSIEAYFNTDKVRSAIHTKLDIAHWSSETLLQQASAQLKNGFIDKSQALDYTSSLKTQVTPLWQFLLAHDVTGVVYYGDTDLVYNLIGGLWAVESLKLSRKGDRAPWFVEINGSKQIGGFVEAFEGLTYVTVKGGGHQVPLRRPAEAKQMLDLFVLHEEDSH